MRHFFRVVTLVIGVLCFSATLANPVMPAFINELFLAPGTWVLEMDRYLPTSDLDGWSMSSHAGTAAFKSGIQVSGGQYRLLTPDSLVTPLAIDAAGDSVTVFRGNGEWYSLVFGSGATARVKAPAPGWSIAWQGYFYLDQSPTLGSPNDLSGSAATVTGIVIDSATGSPLPHALIEEWASESMWWSGDSGKFSLSLPARNTWLAVSLSGYRARSVTVSLVPGQTIDTTIYLSLIASVGQPDVPRNALLLSNYPNPFNPSTTIQLELPGAGKTTLTLYDVLGKEITELIRGFRPAGQYHVLWNGRNENGAPVGSGIYLARLRVKEGDTGAQREKTIKLLLVR